MLKFLKQLVGGTEPGGSDSPRTLPEAARAGANRFAQWVGENCQCEVPVSLQGFPSCDEALNRYRSEKGGDEPPESLANDFACYVGEAVRGEFGGEWREHPVWDFNVESLGGVPHGKLLPMAIVERKWREGDVFSLEAFANSLAGRIDAEKELSRGEVPSPAALREEIDGLRGSEAQRKASVCSEQFRTYWRQRHGASLPLTLMGVREVDRFLRTHFMVNFLEEGHLVLAGFYLGEVARGLFNGEWNFEELPSVTKAALRYPELDYFPVGRVYKMMTEQPEGEPLDEYIRLVPSARSELRKASQEESRG